jgi:hypothetical protein
MMDLALWVAGVGHFVILVASAQIPSRLGWREDLAKLTPFNRKLMWTYAGFTVLTIIAFGVLTLVLHNEMVRGDRAALALAAFIGIYWTTRILVDLIWFGHSGWPRGVAFVVGHALLFLLFGALAATYIGVVLCHV